MNSEQGSEFSDVSRDQFSAGGFESLSYQPKEKKRKKGSVWRVFWAIFTGMSVLANILLFLMVIGLAAFFAAGAGKDFFTEKVIQEGPRANKIAVINLKGVIDDRQADGIYRQISFAGKDKNVKGLILRVNSPGGTISASDQIHNEILKFRDETEKPVVAFMQSIAASGGYYTSVACDKIVAEPTVITGSIGVIMAYFVLEDLLEGKLGIKPVVVKSGLKKDWPSAFQPPTEDQLKYLEDKLIMPAYERFVEIVADGREALTIADVKNLADGSIFGAREALAEKMVDKIGYMDEAIEEIKALAEIEDARVVEYTEPFSFTRLLSSQSKSIFHFDAATFYELRTPQAMYLWRMP